MIRKSVFHTIFLISILCACSEKKQDNNKKQPISINSSFSSHIQTTKATAGNQEKEMTLTGKIISNPDKTIQYTPLISGIIQRTYFSLGDKVSKGQTLLDIQSSELNALHTELITLESEVKIAERELKSAQAMYEDSMLSERELLEAQSKLLQAQTSLEQTRNDIGAFGTSKGKGVFSIQSPIDGYIIAKNASPGSPVSAEGEPLFIVADLSSIWVIANVYASHLQFVQEGTKAIVTIPSYPNETFEGEVSNLSQVFDPEDKALKARIILPNRELKLKPEMSVVIKLKEEANNNLVVIPSDALIFDNDAYYAIVKEADNDYSVRDVVLYDHNGQMSYIASGVKAGEEVVSKNQLLIYAELKGK